MNQNQDAFNTIVRGLLKQGTPSLDDQEACAYRGEHGHKCAVGMLISDEFYTVHLEAKNVRNPTVAKALKDSGWTDVDHFFLRDLQVIHDEIAPEKWPAAFVEIAQDYNLECPEELKCLL
jgi:hypothetical protein